MNRTRKSLIACLSLVLALTVACSSTADDPSDATGSDVQVADSQSDPTADLTPDGTEPDATVSDQGEESDISQLSPVVDSDHTGWQTPNCLPCHSNTDSSNHRFELLPYQCADCHYTNGAESRPSGHFDSTCGGCHPEVATSHGGTDVFPDPISCQTCHPLP